MSEELDLTNLTDKQLALLKHFLSTAEETMPEEPQQANAISSSAPTPNKKTATGRISSHRGKEPENDRGVPARIENVQLSGNNEFEKLDEFHANKSDSKDDALLWGDNRRTSRRNPFEPIEATCRECGETDFVHPRFVVKDMDARKYVYTCNNCSRR